MRTPTLTEFMKDEFTEQEVFDYILLKIREQGKPSMVPHMDGGSPICAYRGNDGCKCGVGHIVTDEELQLADANKKILFDKYFIESSVNTISIGALSEALGFDYSKNRIFLSMIQSAHDQSSKTHENFMEAFELGMKFVADKLNLRYNEP